MSRKSTPSFIVELPLSVPTTEAKRLRARFETARRLYNAYLGEALRRLTAMRESPDYASARALTDKAERKVAFGALSERYGYSEYALPAFAATCRNQGKFDNRIGANENQKLATRAFKAVAEYRKGTRGKPRFKSGPRAIHSIEGKNNTTGLRWIAGAGVIVMGSLTLHPLLPSSGRDPWLEEALKANTKYVRLVRRVVKSKTRWFAQLIQEGQTPLKYRAAKGVVGLDVGPQTIGIASHTWYGLARFAPSVEQPWKQSRVIERAMDRSRRATNPNCYNQDGNLKKGARIKVRSGHYEALRKERAEVERVLAARREREHGNLANRILGLGNTIQAETLSYKSFQKNFGRSVKVRAPGMFMALLQRKAERAGGAWVNLDTWSLKLSQFDHKTQTYTKKPLSQRWHALGDGEGFVQRDVYSAFLARLCAEKGIQPHHAEAAWSIAQPLLVSSGWMKYQCANVKSLLGSPLGYPPAAERIEDKMERVPVIAYGNTGAPTQSSLRTPCPKAWGGSEDKWAISRASFTCGVLVGKSSAQ